MFFPSFALALLAALHAPQEPPIASEASFLDGLSEVETLIESRKCARAQEQLARLLKVHEPHGYVFVHRPRVIEDIELASFWSTHKSPDPRTLISGELSSYNPSGYNIKLRYTPATLGDFLRIGSAGKQETAAVHDVLSQELTTTFVHPLVFAGPYSIEIRGASFPSPSFVSKSLPVIEAGWEHGDGFLAVFGLAAMHEGNTTYSADATLRSSHGASVEDLDRRSPSPVIGGNRADFKVKLEQNSISAAYNGTKLLNGRKPSGVFGQVAFRGFDEFEELVLQGQAEPSWMQGLIDAEVERQWKEFEKDFSVAHELPRWLQLESCGAFKPMAFRTDSYPGPERDGQAEVLEKARSLIAGKRWAEGVAFSTQLDKAATTEEFRRWLRAVFLERTDAFELSIKECERVCELSPQFRPARVLRAELRYMMRQRESALADLRVLMDEDHADRQVPALLARSLLLMGRSSELEAVVRAAAESGTYTSEMDFLNSARCKAARGPSWSKRFEHTSKHYRVASDINRATCVEIADRLETALANVQRRLEPAKTPRSEPYPVYVFSGEASYKRYVASALLASTENTWGVYSPTLKQLLLWNVPDRDDLLRTARHEGFHQYLDSVIAEPPYWLNEGLAEYFGSADYTKAGSDEMRLLPGRLAELRQQRGALLPLKDLLHMVDADSFYSGNVSLHYSEAWAFVHFLQSTTVANRKLLLRLFELLHGELSSREAVDQAFAGTDLDGLQREFESYVADLDKH